MLLFSVKMGRVKFSNTEIKAVLENSEAAHHGALAICADMGRDIFVALKPDSTGRWTSPTKPGSRSSKSNFAQGFYNNSRFYNNPRRLAGILYGGPGRLNPKNAMKLPSGFRRTCSRMSEQAKLSTDEWERRIRQLQEVMSRMSADELCRLIRDIEAITHKTSLEN
jgi:hypothetical protein